MSVASVAAYIDGFNLYFGMKHKYGRRYHWLDVVELVRQVRPQDQVAVARYFSAIVKNERAAAQNQQDYIDAMQAHAGAVLDVNIGRFVPRRIKDCCRCGSGYTCRCPRPYRSFEEKETDVGVGAMMVADAALGIGDVTLFVSADTDFVPAVRAVRLVAPTRRVYVAMPPGNTGRSNRFNQIPNVTTFFIKETALRNAQLPATLTDTATGRMYTRPAKWK